MREIPGQWIDQAMRGNRRAMDKVLKECENPVYHIALGILSDPEDAADAAQQALWNIYRGLNKFRFESAFSSWVYRITFRCCMDIKRRRRDSPMDPQQGYPILEKQTMGNDTDRVDQKLMLQQAMEQLPEEMRQVLVLRAYCDLSYEEIARMLKVEMGTVKSRLFRARDLLRKRLEEMGYFKKRDESGRT